MFYIFLSALLFGFVHPGSKWILSQGLDLMSFCLFYVLFRLLSQLPMVIQNRSYRLPSRHWKILMLLGLVGAALQFLEFKGIAQGLPVPLVTFLVYSHPIWSLLLSRVINQEPLSGSSWLKLGAGLLGLSCIIGEKIFLWQNTGLLMVAPVLAGLMIALWISLSHKAKASGVPTWTLSFYYDLFTLAALLVLRSAALNKTSSLPEMTEWILLPKHFMTMLAYSFFVGLLPNLLFYKGQSLTTARTAGLLLLLEPLVATAVSHALWKDPLPPSFLIGTLFILLAGVPMTTIRFPKWISATALGCALLLATLFPQTARAGDPPAVHGMLVFGEQSIYFSHLPMFHKPHDYQALMQIQWPEDVSKMYLQDKKQHPDVIYTFVPRPMVLPDVVLGQQSFQGDLYRGHFEQDGQVLQKNISVQIKSVVYFQKLDPSSTRPTALTYLFFGEHGEYWLAHLITAQPDFDQILSVSAAEGSSSCLATFSRLASNQPLPSSPQLSGACANQTLNLSQIHSYYLNWDDLAM